MLGRYKNNVVGLLAVMLLLFGFGQKEEMPKTSVGRAAVYITDDFTHEEIGSKVLVANKEFSEALLKKNYNNPDLLKEFRASTKKEVLFGIQNTTSQYWILFKVINQSTKVQDLVFYTPHMGSDALKMYSINKGKLKPCGRIHRLTPLYQRPSQFFDFALPLSVQAQDTTIYLLESSRFMGFHRLIPQIATPQYYTKSSIYQNGSHLIECSFIVALMLTTLFLGLFYKQKSMLYFVLYLSNLLLLLLSYFGYLDFFSPSNRISINSYSLSLFSLLGCNITVHPFMYHLVRVPTSILKTYRQGAKTLIFLNLCVVLLGFLPTNVFMYFNTFMATSVNTLAAINMCWILYHAFIIFVKAKIPQLLIIELIIFLPPLLQVISNWLFFNTFMFPHLTFLPHLSIAAFFVLLLLQLKNDLTTKKNLRLQERNLIKIRKTEIEAIGRNLHDNVGNILVSAYEYLNLKENKLEIIQSLLIDAINEVRFISHNLVNDKEYAITEKIDALVSRLNDCSVVNFKYRDFSLEKLNTLAPHQQQNIYMIIQEIMTNIIKHARATEATLQIFDTEKTIQLIIEDDGIGMENAIPNKGIGLKNIEKRAAISNFKITIDSTSYGTNFIIEIPYEN